MQVNVTDVAGQMLTWEVIGSAITLKPFKIVYDHERKIGWLSFQTPNVLTPRIYFCKFVQQKSS